jgi:hypothetical protein
MMDRAGPTRPGNPPSAPSSGSGRELFRPSTMAISTSSTPRFFSLVMTRSQNLAPAVCSIQRPRISLVPSGGRTPRAR